MFKRETGPTVHARREIDQQHRDELLSVIEDRLIEGIGLDLVRRVAIFGVTTALTKIERENGEAITVYRTDAEQRAAGYVPLLWVEFGGSDVQSGSFLEIWPKNERLVGIAQVEGGKRPYALPVQNSRVMTARALNIAKDGRMAEPHTSPAV